jgi:hypothetical protein
MLYSDLPGVYIIGYIPYVGVATHYRATVRTRLCLCKKKKKKTGRHKDYQKCSDTITRNEKRRESLRKNDSLVLQKAKCCRYK